MFADRFVHLKRWRERSDYDHRSVVTPPIAVSACTAARDALTALAAARNETGWATFCTLLMTEATGKIR